MDWRPLVKEHISNIDIPLDVLNFFWVFKFLQGSLLCIMRKAEGGSLAVAVGVSDIRHKTCDM